MSQISQLPQTSLCAIFTFLSAQDRGAFCQTFTIAHRAQKQSILNETTSYTNDMNTMVAEITPLSTHHPEVQKCGQIWHDLQTSWTLPPHPNPYLCFSASHRLELDKIVMQALARRIAHNIYIIRPGYQLKCQILQDSVNRELQACRNAAVQQHNDNRHQQQCYNLTRRGLYEDALVSARAIIDRHVQCASLRDFCFTMASAGHSLEAMEAVEKLNLQKDFQIILYASIFKGLLKASTPQDFNEPRFQQRILTLLRNLKKLDNTHSNTTAYLIEEMAQWLIKKGQSDAVLQILKQIEESPDVSEPTSPVQTQSNLNQCIASELRLAICIADWERNEKQQAIKMAHEISMPVYVTKFLFVIVQRTPVEELDALCQLLNKTSMTFAFHQEAIEMIINLTCLSHNRKDLAEHFINYIPHPAQRSEAHTHLAKYCLFHHRPHFAAMHAAHIFDEDKQSTIYGLISQYYLRHQLFAEAKAHALLMNCSSQRSEAIKTLISEMLKYNRSDTLEDKIAQFLENAELISHKQTRHEIYQEFLTFMKKTIGYDANTFMQMGDLVLSEKHQLISNELLLELALQACATFRDVDTRNRLLNYFASLMTNDHLRLEMWHQTSVDRFIPPITLAGTLEQDEKSNT